MLDPSPHLASIRLMESTPVHRLDGMQSFLHMHSPIRAMAVCGQEHPCRRRLCPWCALRASRTARRELRALITEEDHALFVRLSLAADHDVRAAFRALGATRARFGRKGWMTSKSRSWLRTTEFTHGAEGWNCHDNLLILGTPEQLTAIKETIVTRWLAAAEYVGATASATAQYVEHARSPRAVAVYAHKGLCGPAADPNSGRTPGDLLRAWYLGDDLAGELWCDLAVHLDTNRSTRMSQRGGALRGRRPEAEMIRKGDLRLAC